MLKIIKGTKNIVQSFCGIYIVNELIRKLNLNTWVEQTLDKRPLQAMYNYNDAHLSKRRFFRFVKREENTIMKVKNSVRKG